VKFDTCLLEGKPQYRIPEWLAEQDPTLVVLGRFGLHRTDDLDLGNTAESLVRRAPCCALVVNQALQQAELDWTEGALERLAVIPEFMQPVVRKAIESHARSRGLTQVTSEVVTEAKTGHGVQLPGHHPKDGSSDG
jgi:hypothetical protein